MPGFWSWFGFGGNENTTNNTPHLSRETDANGNDPDTEPLLAPENPDADTPLQAAAHEKMRTYMILRALSKGYIPSTEQTIAQLRSILSIDALNPSNTALTPSGRKLVRDARHFIQALIVLLKNKNSDDQLQEFLWCTSRARAGFDGAELVHGVQEGIGAASSAPTGLEAVRTVADLLMMNAEFRKLMGDVAVIGRQVLADAAGTGAGAAEKFAEVVRPSEGEMEEVASKVPVEAMDREGETNGENVVGETVEVLGEGVVDTANAALESAKEGLMDEGRREALSERLKRAVLRLRGRADYTESVNIISVLLKRYAITYSRSVSGAVDTVTDSVETNSELDEAVKRFWMLITAFGDDHNAWMELSIHWHKLLDHFTTDDQFEKLVHELGDGVQDVLTDPSFTESEKMAEKLDTIRGLISQIGGDNTNIRDDVDAFLSAVEHCFASILCDKDITSLITTSHSLFANLWPTPYTLNPDLMSDLTHVLFPLLLATIQNIPIIRLTVATPEIDLLLENLIINPGDTINSSSFFPHKISLNSSNDFELSKARERYTSVANSTLTTILRGFTLRAENIGYYLRAHTGIWRFWDTGLVSFAVDQNGLDIKTAFALSRTSIEEMITLTNVDVTVHNLSYTIIRSRFRWMMAPFGPVLRPILRRLIKRNLEQGIKDVAHTINRELVYARERLRAARVAEPRSLWKFLRAVGAGWSGGEGWGEEVDVFVGARRRKEEPKVLQGKFAPGSLVRVWEEEGERVCEVVDVQGEGAWRNAVFDLKV